MEAILTGIKPTNNLHIGNLFGSILNFKNFIKKDYLNILFVADLHSLTSSLHINKQHIYDIFRYTMATLDNLENILFFIQSDLMYATNLLWILSCVANIGSLFLMTQYKQYAEKYNNVGLFTYPVLMAADILCLNANYVPVGIDQKQHLELTRDLAIKFNNKYNTNLFTIPEIIINEAEKIYNISNSSVKMSKSIGSINGVIFLNETKESLWKKIKSAQTDSHNHLPKSIEELNKRDSIKNLYTIYAQCTKEELEVIIKRYKNYNYVEFKKELYLVLWNFLEKIQGKFNQITNKDIEEKINNDKKIIENRMKNIYDKVRKIIF